MSFKDMVAADLKGVFLNPEEFGETRTIQYDGEVYEDIPVVLTRKKEEARSRKEDDHTQGIFRASFVMHCALSDLGGDLPEQGTRLRLGDGKGFFRTFYVSASGCEMGMVRLEMEVLDE